MPIWVQHVLVLTIAGVCLAYALWQGFQSLRGKASRVGSCCAKGCSAQAPSPDRVVFIPSDALRRKS